MLPADYHVASFWFMPLLLEVTRPELKLNLHPLPFVSSLINTTLGLAIWIVGSYSFNYKAEFETDHPKKEHNTLLIERRML